MTGASGCPCDDSATSPKSSEDSLGGISDNDDKIDYPKLVAASCAKGYKGCAVCCPPPVHRHYNLLILKLIFSTLQDSTTHELAVVQPTTSVPGFDPTVLKSPAHIKRKQDICIKHLPPVITAIFQERFSPLLC